MILVAKTLGIIAIVFIAVISFGGFFGLARTTINEMAGFEFQTINEKNYLKVENYVISSTENDSLDIKVTVDEDGIISLKGENKMQGIATYEVASVVLTKGEYEAVFDEEQPLDNEENRQKAKEENNEPIPYENREPTPKEIFESLYEKSTGKNRTERREYILKHMLQHFSFRELAEEFVEKQLEMKLRNLICRRMRLARKIALNDFNYFVTFTYDDEKHTEETFKKALSKCLSNLASRKDWKYAGVWERAPKTNRLHFHGIFNIPEGTMPGIMIEEDDYNFKLHRRKKTIGNSFFKGKFGRCEFDKISSYQDKGQVMCYLMKYIEKSGEKIVYSRGLARYILTQVYEGDVVCPFDEYETKYILYDNFVCWHEGEYIGEISKEIIEQMPKIV